MGRSIWIIIVVTLIFIGLGPTLRNLLHNFRSPVLDVERTGNGEDIVLLHGLTGTRQYWEPLISAFSDNFRMTTPDLVGFGGSQWPADGYDLEHQIAALESVLPETFVLVGHSMGSLIALEIARQMPERVKKLVLLAPPMLSDRTELKKVLRQESTLQSVMALDSFWAPFICHLHELLGPLSFYVYRTFVNPALPDRVVRGAMQHRWESYDLSLTKIVLGFDVVAALKKVSAPTLILTGAEDQYVKRELLQEAFLQMASPRTVVMPGGHNFLWEHQDETAREIQKFIESQ